MKYGIRERIEKKEEGKLIKIQSVSKIYPNGVRALDAVSLSISDGEFVSIIGKSGSGKSTLMNIIGCLDKPTNGDYEIDGVHVQELNVSGRAKLRNRMIGFIFQGFNLSAKMTAYENVELPLVFRGIPAAQRRERVYSALERVGLAARAQHLPGQLSGGQQQRVAIARAIAARPPIILADEPTGSLDKASGNACIELLHALNNEGHTLILITHDFDYTYGAHRVFRLDDGHLEEISRLPIRQSG